MKRLFSVLIIVILLLINGMNVMYAETENAYIEMEAAIPVHFSANPLYFERVDFLSGDYCAVFSMRLRPEQKMRHTAWMYSQWMARASCQKCFGQVIWRRGRCHMHN